MFPELAETGESVTELKRQFRKKVIEGGSLKGAHYVDVGPQELAKAARSYRGDQRFQQFAKRMVAARTLGSKIAEQSQSTADQRKPSFLASKFKTFCCWPFGKIKKRVFWSLCISFILCVFLSRPMLYVLLGKLATVGIKLLIRQSMGTLAVIFDAVLDELSAQLDSVLAPRTPEPREVIMPTVPQAQIQPAETSFTNLVLNLICVIVGTVISPLLGQRWPRAQGAAHEHQQ